uniref:AAA ATPase n=1 Tax=Caulobacter sp. (strain K31) TaxID=366602 RepID=B0T9H4_CAUSK
MVATVIEREALSRTVAALDRWPCVGLYGPRSVGKSSLADQIAKDRGDEIVRLHFGRQADRDRLRDQAAFFAAHGDKLVVIDEIHLMPEAFRIVRARLDDWARPRPGAGQFLFMGSESHQVRAMAAEALGGHSMAIDLTTIQPHELPTASPITLMETFDALHFSVPEVEPTASANQALSMDQLWSRGGLPNSLLASDEAESYVWRRNYLDQIFALAPSGPNAIDGELRHCLEMIATEQGGQTPLTTSPKTFRAALERLKRMGLVRELRPWSGNAKLKLTKNPKLYIRDSGLFHVLRGCRTRADLDNADDRLLGGSWEGFCIEAIAARLGERADLFFYRIEASDELDLVIEFTLGERWVVEIKSNPMATIGAGFWSASAALDPKRKVIVHQGDAAVTNKSGLEALPLRMFLDQLGAKAPD